MPPKYRHLTEENTQGNKHNLIKIPSEASLFFPIRGKNSTINSVE
jgi:hypothetical protein